MGDAAADVDDTTRAIMEATYRALSKHGYSATSISKIADEFEKSKSLLYYHYEDKEDLLDDFLRFLLERLEADLDSVEADDPTETLYALVDRLLPAEMDDEALGFRRSLLEIRSEAPYHDSYRNRFEETDRLIRTELTETIDRGIETGQFDAVDVDEVVEFVLTVTYGTLERAVTLDDRSIVDRSRRTLRSYLETNLGIEAI